jgi:hypothetical protein
MRRFARMLVPAMLLSACLPARADAQWYFGAYMGANHTSSADVSFNEPAGTTAIVFHDVSFESQPFVFPLYAGGRFGYRFRGRRFGVEAEWLHMKVIAETNQMTRVTGTLFGTAIDSTFPMDLLIQRYEMTHGLNFLMGNLVLRQPLGAGSSAHTPSVVFRVGAGPVVSGTDSKAGDIVVQRYEHAGFGGQATAGLDVPIGGPWSAMVEYKFTYAKPQISVGGGQGQTTAMASQIAFGLAIGFSRRD